MQRKQLGNSDLYLTPIGVGAWAMGGGGWAFAWGHQDDNDSISAIQAAVDAGINWIDTAAVYGLGHSEEVVGKALAGLAAKPYVFTKCSRTWNEQGQIIGRLKRESIRRECEDSLRRLKVDVIDLYQMHRPEPDEDLEEGWETMADLQRAGKVRWIGLSNASTSQMERAGRIAPITSLQPAYSLASPGIEKSQLPYCLEHGIGVLVYSPMQHGVLSGKMTRERVANLPEDDFRRRNPQFQEPLLTRNLAIAGKLGQMAARHGRTAGEAAIAWTLRHPAVTAAIAGVRSAAQVRELAGAIEFRLSSGELAEIDAFVAALK